MSDRTENDANENNRTKKHNGARMNIMWEEQLVDPTTDYLTSVNLP